MADDVSTDSYPKPPAFPAQKTLLDNVGQYQQLESNKIGIDLKKLELMNNHFQLMQNDLSTMLDNPNTTKDDIATRMTARMKTFNAPPALMQQMQEELKAAPSPQAFLTNTMVRSMDTNQRINKIYGVPGAMQNGQTYQPTLQRTGKPPVSAGDPVQIQLPVDTPQLDMRETLPDGSPNPQFNTTVLGGPQLPQIPAGTRPSPNGLPGQYQRSPTALPPGPVRSPAVRGPSGNFGGNVLGASVEQPTFNDRFNGVPSGPRTGFAPGVKEASTVAGQASGTQLANDRNSAAHFQRDVFPLAQAIPDLEKLGTKGSGPGTETINHLKSFILSNIPGISKDDPAFESVPTYDKAKKYLTDFVNQTGNTGTNDKLAASFAGNPSVGISNAAAVDVAKSALALRRMQQATLMEFERSGLPPDKYSQWVAKRTQEIDPRAFGVDMMKPEAKKVLLDQLNKDKKEKTKFEKSLELAHSLGFITPK